MAKQQPFSVNVGRLDPYKSYAFLVFIGSGTTPVAGVSKVTALKRSNDVIEHKEGGNAIIRKGIGRMKYEPITLEQGVTHDETFAAWADAVQVLDNGAPQTSLKLAQQNLAIVLCNEARQPVLRYIVYRAWVSEFQALPDLDAGTNAVAIQHIKLENHGWARDLSLTEPQEL
jgi:phage tail-like protein